MSQNQSYFWQTKRRNVILKRTAKLHMLYALMAVMTFATICIAEIAGKAVEETVVTAGAPTKLSDGERNAIGMDMYDAGLELPRSIDDPDSTKDAVAREQSNVGFVDGFTASLSVILFTELGDKTFFIAAIMAMRHPRLVVFVGAISALALMTVLSVVFGMAATIIPKVYTYYISTALFAIFGFKMIYDGYFMKDSDAQEEMEEVQSDLRKREDELLRSKRNKYDDNETKRKNSNSDKDDDVNGRGDATRRNVERTAGGVDDDGDSAGIGLAAGSSNAAQIVSSMKNPEMQHRQRRQPISHSSSNNKKQMNGCDLNKNKDDNNDNFYDDDDDDDVDVDGENDAFLMKGVGNSVGIGGANGGVERLKMSTFHSSPALSSSLSSNQTNQTICDEYNLNDTPHFKKHYMNNSSSTVIVHSASAGLMTNNNHKNNNKNKMNGIIAPNGDHNNRTNSLSSISLNSSASVVGSMANGELKQKIGGSKKRLERDVSAAHIKDPESGIVRKNTKKGAAYLTTRVLMQAFTMTFLAEWGDRSQLTTIILAASKNVYGVICGGIIGHSICTGLAVVGGRIVAAKISVRTVTIVGGIVFLGFAVYALIWRPEDI